MICLDASVAARMILDDEKPSDRALALYTGAVRTGALTVEPPMPIEVTNILRQRMHVQDGISVMEATRLLDKFLTLPIYHPQPRVAASRGACSRRYPESASSIRCSLAGPSRASRVQVLER